MGENAENGMVLCMLWSLPWKFAHPVCSSRLYLVWIYVIKGHGYFPALGVFWETSGLRALENSTELSEFCKVLPSSEQDEK